MPQDHLFGVLLFHELAEEQVLDEVADLSRADGRVPGQHPPQGHRRSAVPRDSSQEGDWDLLLHDQGPHLGGLGESHLKELVGPFLPAN